MVFFFASDRNTTQTGFKQNKKVLVQIATNDQWKEHLGMSQRRGEKQAPEEEQAKLGCLASVVAHTCDLNALGG